ncbi:hypothetical protein MRX96_049343 [Rhipicephalus microplus]
MFPDIRSAASSGGGEPGICGLYSSNNMPQAGLASCIFLLSGVIVRGSGINPVSSVVSGPAAVSARERGALHVPPLWAAAVPCRREGAAARGVGGFPTVGGGDPVRPGTGTLSPLWSLLANEAPLSLVGRTGLPTPFSFGVASGADLRVNLAPRPAAAAGRV